MVKEGDLRSSGRKTAWVRTPLRAVLNLGLKPILVKVITIFTLISLLSGANHGAGLIAVGAATFHMKRFISN